MPAVDEYRSRQTLFAEALADDGYDGALVVSRGGSTFDRYGPVLYLTGHYQHYSYLPDAPGLFSGRAHTALVAGRDGRLALCVSVPEYQAASIAVEDIRVSGDFVGTIAEALSDLGLTTARIALVGADTLPARYWLKLRSRSAGAVFVEADETLARLMRAKSTAEQDVIRRAAAIHRHGVTAMMEEIRPGATEADLVAALANAVMRDGAALYFTSVASGPDSGRWASSPFPGFSRRKLETGDLVRFDTGIVYEGYLSDFGRTRVVGEASPEQRRLLETLHGGLEAAIAAVRPGARVRSIIAAGEAALAEAGVIAQDDGSGRIVSSFPVHWGHGLGLGWERPWMTDREDIRIRPGQYLAIERALKLPGVGTAAAEQTLIVGDDGTDVLTGGPDGFWS